MPANTSVLLTLEPMSAILARVAYRLIQRDYLRNPTRYDDPPTGLGDLTRELMSAGFPTLSIWVAAYGYHARKRVSCAAYKQRVVRRSRWARLNREGGKPWARVPEE